MGERIISPEVIWGRNFRVPAIVGEGSGRGFKFSGLHLLPNCAEAIPKLKQTDLTSFQNRFTFSCEERGFKPGEIKFDEETGFLKEISINTEPVSRLTLVTEYPYASEGIYKGENVNDLRAAIIMQSFVARFLNAIQQEYSIPYIEGGGPDGDGYSSIYLQIPKKFLQKEELIPFSQRSFELLANNIAGRFGLTLRRITFNQKGILNHFDVEEGDACGYDLEERFGDLAYTGHNVDSAYQVAALHGIGAAFINHLLRKEDREPY